MSVKSQASVKECKKKRCDISATNLATFLLGDHITAVKVFS